MTSETIHIERLFTTPVASLVYPQAESLNAQLSEIINSRMQADTGVSRSNSGGWQSSADFPEWAGEPGQALLAFALDFATRLTAVHSDQHGIIEPNFEWRFNAWANVNQAGHGNDLHGHPGAFWSGVYWVDDGGYQENPDVGGKLEFIDPRGLVPSVYNPALRMRIEGCLAAGCSTTMAPRAGTFVMFPSWLMHSVQRFNGPRPRISIAFNFGV